jgi:hypothetical protein
VVKPFAFTPARHVHAHDVATIGQAGGEHVEIPAVSREAVHAKDKVLAARIAPFDIGNFVKAVRTKTVEAIKTRLGCHSD